MSIRVAIVDDDERLRGSLAMLVGGSPGFELIGSYADGESALDNIPKTGPEVVLMDINLPKISGIECTRRLKPLLPKLQIIMLTAYEDEERVFEALKAGASGYLIKRTPPVEVLEAMQDVLRGGSPMSSGIARMVVEHFQRSEQRQPPAKRQEDQPHLSPREEEVLAHLAQGYRYKEIADRLECSIHTIREHIRRIYEKLQVTSGREAVAKFLRRPQ